MNMVEVDPAAVAVVDFELADAVVLVPAHGLGPEPELVLGAERQDQTCMEDVERNTMRVVQTLQPLLHWHCLPLS